MAGLRLSLALAFILTSAYSAQAGAMLRNMTCDIDKRVRVEERSLQTGNAVEAQGNVVVVDPGAFYDLPQVAVSFEFGEACLKAAGWNYQTCDIIEYLRQRELIVYSDLETLQFYLEDRASRQSDPEKKDAYWRQIKEIYACF